MVVHSAVVPPERLGPRSLYYWRSELSVQQLEVYGCFPLEMNLISLDLKASTKVREAYMAGYRLVGLTNADKI